MPPVVGGASIYRTTFMVFIRTGHCPLRGGRCDIGHADMGHAERDSQRAKRASLIMPRADIDIAHQRSGGHLGLRPPGSRVSGRHIIFDIVDCAFLYTYTVYSVYSVYVLYREWRILGEMYVEIYFSSIAVKRGGCF